MTGQDVLRRALQLLGYTDSFGEPDGRNHAEVYKRALAVTEQLVCELCVQTGATLPAPLRSLREELPLPPHIVRGVLPYGVAMHLAAAEGDGDNQALFAALYDQKRTAMQRHLEHRTDRLPRGWDL
ncbi:MAG: hypothetical protein IJP14_02955 [Clostridia bacterium]|nr:hypothetical protein [Clostridia bacterium]